MLESPRCSIDKSDTSLPSYSKLEESVLTLDGSTASLRDLNIYEINDFGLSLSKIITDSDEDDTVEELESFEACESFTTQGCCLKGQNCNFEHRTAGSRDSIKTTNQRASNILHNFPELILLGPIKRTRSFLEWYSTNSLVFPNSPAYPMPQSSQ